jgi:hypothetical protein
MFYATDTGEVWLCVAGGTPGSWRLIAGPQAAGAYCPITPVRVYDSRWGTVPGLTTGALTNTTVRAIPTANGRNNTGAITTPDAIPAGARALTVNLTITGTINTGYIALVPGNQQTTTTSSINWTATGQTAANGLTVPLDPTNRTLNAICAASTTNATPGRTHIIIDVTGYYLGL